jgi:hypothetical protein
MYMSVALRLLLLCEHQQKQKEQAQSKEEPIRSKRKQNKSKRLRAHRFAQQKQREIEVGGLNNFLNHFYPIVFIVIQKSLHFFHVAIHFRWKEAVDEIVHNAFII